MHGDGPGSSGDAVPHPAARGDGDDGADIDGEAAVEELAALREEAYDPEDEERCFYCRIFGGTWTAAHKLVPSDAVVGLARAGLAKDWCPNF